MALHIGKGNVRKQRVSRASVLALALDFALMTNTSVVLLFRPGRISRPRGINGGSE